MLSYVVTANRTRQIERALAFKDGAQTVQFDYSPWSDDNGDIDSVSWTVKAGNAAVSGEALASNVASALITTSEEGGSLIQIKAVAGNNIHISYLDILAKDPERPARDYGLLRV